MYVAIIALLSLISCNSSKKLDVKSLSTRWIATQTIDLEQNFILNKLIEKPRNIFNPLIKIGYFNYYGEILYDCLYYKPVNTKEAGVFKVIKNPKNDSCQKIVFEKSYFKTDEVFNFKLNIKKNILELYIDKDLYTFKMLNYGSYANTLYKGAVKETEYQGISYFSDIKERSLKKEIKLKDGMSCLKVNDFCESSVNTCKTCVNGWHEVMDSACKNKFSRVCGIDKCGTKDNPACLRGIATVGLDPKFYCINDSPFGFCQQRLRVFCSNSKLVCR